MTGVLRYYMKIIKEHKKLMYMKKIILFFLLFFSVLVVSCVSSKSTTTVARGYDISKYQYVVFGGEDDGECGIGCSRMQYLRKNRNE